MKLGDLVKWIGFPGATVQPEEKYGIIIKKIYTHPAESSDRINVLWGGGTIGKALYQETVEVVSESRRFSKKKKHLGPLD
tara:strand:- start:245 stop:484 length:240 start_codon:yes stop_codon:yes gene_type:complete